MHVQASEKGSNFSQAKEAVEIIQLQHPLVYDQHDLCASAIAKVKLPMLQCGCEDLELGIYLSHPCAERLHTRRF